VASTKLPTVGETPVHFKAVSVTIPSGASSSVSSTNGILYQLSGSTEVSIGGEVKTLGPGEGLFIASGNAATLKAGDGGPSTALHFLLAPAADLDKPLEAQPAVVQELYRTVAPWAAAGFEDTLLRWNLKLEVGHGNETAIQSGVQA
jgi:quercetin dioxygenase-like cupin family protein